MITPLDGFHRSPILVRLGWSLDSRILLLDSPNCPRHARSVVGNPEAALCIEQNNSAVAVQTLLQVVHRFLRDPLGQASGFDAVRRPLREHQLHDGLTPSGSGRGGAEIV